MISRKLIFFLLLAAMPLLIGSQCAFFFSSGDDSSDSDDDDKRSGLVVIVNTNSSAGSPVEGLNYVSGSLSGITGKNGEFQYEADKSIRFFIGDIGLGRAVNGKSVITPQDLVEDGASNTPAATNITRLLQSLDSDPGDEAITISEAVRLAAVRSNEGLSSSIEFLDFSDDTTFVNTASHLVAALTHDYPFTAVLVDADNTRTPMLNSTNNGEK